MDSIIENPLAIASDFPILGRALATASIGHRSWVFGSKCRYGSVPSDAASRPTLQPLGANLGLLFAVGILVATFVAYALGFFQETSGVLVLPGDATLVGFLAAVVIGSQRGGLVFAWLAPFASNVGFYADWAFLGLSSHSLAGKLAFLFAPVRLSWISVTAVIVGTVGFGSLGRQGIERLRATHPDDSP